MAQYVANQAQAIVAGGVAIGVVEPLEVVHVEHDERDRSSIAGCPGKFVRQLLVEMAAVAQSGQRVGTGLTVEFRIVLFECPPGLP